MTNKGTGKMERQSVLLSHKKKLVLILALKPFHARASHTCGKQMFGHNSYAKNLLLGLYYLCINDILNASNFNTDLYVDDINLNISGKNYKSLEKTLQLTMS